MNAIDLLVGRKIIVETEVGVDVELEIKNVEIKRHSRQITPDTPENDWWGETENWNTYKVTFTTGKSKEYSNLTDIEVI